VSVLADEILKNVEYNALRIVFNKFHSVVSLVPTVSIVLSPEIVERESESGGKLGELDSYEVEGEVAVLSQEAYILLYAKQGIPWFSTAIEVQKPCADPGISDSSPKS
ncbi:hypothetical protein Gotur_021256, partial [Gossypium turneri]